MKTNFLISLFVAISLISCTNSSDKTEEKDETSKELSDTLQTVSEETDTTFYDYNLPKELVYQGESDDVLIAKFFPIGWSRDGKLAYVKEPVDEAAGLYFFEIAVIDLITDKILWQWEYNDEDESKPQNVKSVWEKSKKSFQEKLNSFGIIPDENIELEQSPFVSNNQKFFIRTKSKTMKDPDFGFEVVTNFKIWVKNEKGEEKQIFSSPKEEYPSSLATKVSGFLQSPFENRICIIISPEIRGYEGPPNVINFQLSGCKIEDSFK